MDCDSALRPCPRLCRNCGSPACQPGLCHRPWIDQGELESQHALYLLTTSCYAVLKAWKKRSAPAFDRRVLRSDPPLLESLEEIRPECLIPIPQSLRRSWQMRGSRAEKIARWLGRERGIPIHPALALRTWAGPRQAELGIRDRLTHPPRFTVSPDYLSRIRGKKILLVDDFSTTGHTLRSAASALVELGATGVHGFCLGTRLPSASA